ncbi:MAG: hypothetical protein RLZZ338_1048, partial [Cyanobacteriota bacterium]
IAQRMEASGRDRQHQKLMQLCYQTYADYLEEIP